MDIKDFVSDKFTEQIEYKSFSPNKINKEWIISIFCLLIMLSCQSYTSKKSVDSNTGFITEGKYDSKDRKQGLIQVYLPSGELFEQANYIDDILDGERILFNIDGQKEIKELYKNGTLHGLYQTYYPNGNIKWKTIMSNGSIDTIAIGYYEDGTIKEEVSFQNNEENGPFKEYHPNGNISWQGTYLNGDNEFGELLSYDTSGVLIKKLHCDSFAICVTTWTKEKGDIVQ